MDDPIFDGPYQLPACGPNTIPADIIFSHKTRMMCIVKDLKNRYPRQNADVKAKEPRNGGIIIFFQHEDGSFSIYYPDNQYKSSTSLLGDRTSGEALTNFWRTLARESTQLTRGPVIKIYVYVRHGYGWHNNKENKKPGSKWGETTPGKGMDSSLYIEPPMVTITSDMNPKSTRSDASVTFTVTSNEPVFRQGNTGEGLVLDIEKLKGEIGATTRQKHRREMWWIDEAKVTPEFSKAADDYAYILAGDPKPSEDGKSMRITFNIPQETTDDLNSGAENYVKCKVEAQEGLVTLNPGQSTGTVAGQPHSIPSVKSKPTSFKWYYTTMPNYPWNKDPSPTPSLPDAKNGFLDAENAGLNLVIVLNALELGIREPYGEGDDGHGICIQAVFCSDLQRTAQTAQIALSVVKEQEYWKNISFPTDLIILPCNHELPDTCGGWWEMPVGFKSGISPSYENETTWSEGNKEWGSVPITYFPDARRGWLQPMHIDASKYSQFYDGARGKTAVDRDHCSNFVFPKNIEFVLNKLPSRLTRNIPPAPVAAPASTGSNPQDGTADESDTKASLPKKAEKKGWFHRMGFKKGGRKRKTKQKRKQRTKRKQKRRRVRVTLCKKKVFHKCKTRKHRKRHS